MKGHNVRLGSAKERCVLAVLALAAGTAVPADTLIDRVWDAEPPPTATDTLHSYISRLRSRLRAATGREAQIVFSSGTYTLRVDPEAVDLLRFRRLRHQGQAVAESGEPERAVTLLREAEALWRQEPLAGLGGEWVSSVRRRLREERRTVRDARVRLELDLGRHAQLIAELSESVMERPIVEPVVADLMIAYYRSGRTAEALDAYRTARTRLRDELGLSPSPALDGLHQRLLRRDPALLLPEPAPADCESAPDNLLRDLHDFTGRTAELRQLADVPDRTADTALPVMVVHGMPGIGKTSLAIHAAHRLRDHYPGGRLYLNLRAHSHEPALDPADALTMLLATIGVSGSGLPGSLDERAALWRDRTAHRKLLLVLDDARDAAQVRPLLPGAATCRVFVTSRRRLTDLEGARSVPLEALAVTEAAAQFTRVAGTARTSDRSEVARVVELCGRHPLAISLTASRLRHHDTWGVSDLADRLAQAPAPLDEIDAPAGITSAFELSYAELTSEQRDLFRTLALHPGPDLTWTAATALAGRASATVRDGLEALLERHLIEETTRERYRFHDLVRDFARRVGTREDCSAVRDQAIGRILDYYLVVADNADRLAYPRRRRLAISARTSVRFRPVLHDSDDGQAWLDVERANLLAAANAAATHATPHARLFPHVLAQSFLAWGTWTTADDLYLSALTSARAADDPATAAQLLVEQSGVLWNRGAHDDALRRAEEAFDLTERLGDRWGQAEALGHMGRAHLVCGRRDQALRCFRDALSSHEAVGNRDGTAETLNLEGIALAQAGRFDESSERFRAALAIREETGDRLGQAKALNNIGEVHTMLNQHQEALRYYERSLVLLRSAGGRRELANLFSNFGNVYRATGETERALDYYRRALGSYRATSDPRCEADALTNIGTTYLASRRHHEALIHFTMAERITNRIGDQYARQQALIGMGGAQYGSQRFGTALETYREALRVAEEIDAPVGVGKALEGMASALNATQGVVAARPLWERAKRLYEELGMQDEANAISRCLHTLKATGS
ncbi:AfsR/SARP family transcriptional regulator [Streptantibioticus parmotrematis]|uniref:AfsR/SARP family transcriptional regulator n=1 Tax=Streptantibioticus parmotrematis TaxID=2873249 RepID=UPI0027DF1E30|nr:BTAD domain-containing putative transcriptional regulator [Streptantibioticus parmotrematis]